jgi:hypothetical protein
MSVDPMGIPGPPTDIPTAEARVARLLEEIHTIEAQILEPTRVHPDGTEYTADALDAWRRRARFSMRRKREGMA